MSRRMLLTATLVLIFSPLAAAQNAPCASGLSSSIFKLMNQVGGTPTPETPTPETPTPDTSTPTTPAPVAKPEILKFKISPAVRQAAIDSFVGEITASSPESGAEWQKLFKSADVFAELDKQAGSMFNLSTSNLADTWALYWSYAWLMTQGRGDDPTRAQMTGLKQQMQSLMLAVPEITKLDDAGKQKMSDTLMLQVALFGVLAEAWKSDPASFKEFGDGLTEGSRGMGFDLSLLTLTDTGFTVKK